MFLFVVLGSPSWHESSKRQLQAGKMLSRWDCLSRKGFSSFHLEWKNSKDFQYFQNVHFCVLIIWKLLKVIQRPAFGVTCGPCWAPLGSFWRILLLSWVAHLVDPCSTPKSRKSWAKGVPRISWVPRCIQRRQKGPKRAPKEVPKGDKMSPKISQNGSEVFFLNVKDNMWHYPLLLQKKKVKTFVFTTLAIWFRLMFTQWCFNS